jgi:hypothetical protein
MVYAGENIPVMPEKGDSETTICPYCDSENITTRGDEITAHELCLDCGAKSLVYRDEWVQPDEHSDS